MTKILLEKDYHLSTTKMISEFRNSDFQISGFAISGRKNIHDLFSIISTKQELDLCADQMVKQIQLSGGINAETDQLFNFLTSNIEGARNISYSVDASYKTPTPSGMNRAIQLGSPFYITVTGEARLGGFWNFNLVHITIVSRAAGVSEHYWK